MINFKKDIEHILEKSARLRESYIHNNYKTLYDDVLNWNIDKKLSLDISFKEKFWYYVNKIDKTFLCQTCNNNTTTFHKNFKDGYRQYCSSKCNLSNESTKEKRKKTVIEIYGVDNIAKLEETKKKQEITNLERYGTKSTFQNEDVRKKWVATIQEKYNVDHYFKTEKFKKQCKELYYEKWGVTHQSQIDEVQEKIKQTNLERYGVETYLNTTHARNSIKKTNKSKQEIEIADWLKKQNILVESNKRNIIKKELDIYLPEYKLAIEFNGLYWHSEIFKKQEYHLEKTTQCQEKNIQLIHIFEDDWKHKKEIVKSIILNKIGKNQNRIYGRKCKIQEVKSNIARKFLNDNHIQGFSKSTYKLGLYYNDELVSLMTFGYRRTNRKKEFELIRFCNKINTSIIGAANKLFKHFLKNYTDDIEEKYLISYADISMFGGSLYNTLGFDFKHRTKPNYFWVVNGLRFHRFKYNKQKLIKEGYDPLMTALEIMNMRGYYRIFGCGQDRYEYHFK